MTIKRRLFYSNFRMIVIAILTLFLISWIFRIVVEAKGFFPTLPPELLEEILREDEARTLLMKKLPWYHYLFIPVFVSSFALIFGVVNNALTWRMTKSIIKPLEPLSEGVRQIHNNNLAYRIDYKNDDEFRPICEAFNEMAARLETSNAQKQKDTENRKALIAGISHDLRTPLTAIKGYLEGMETGVAATREMRQQYFTIIKNKTKDMEHIIQQLFMFCKLDMDEFPLTLRRTDIGEALADMTEEAANEYAARGLEIHLAETPRSLSVSADPLLLRNVIFNILENSVKYKTQEKGAMHIRCEVINSSILLRFADNGPGVQPEALENLFDVFYRADPSRNTKGSGLGLAISAKIIERMGGSVYAQLPEEGGLAIIIRLPLLSHEAAP